MAETQDHSDIEQERGLTRRQALLAGAAASAGLMIPAALAATVAPAAALADAIALAPEQEEGPFYVALERVRKDIVSGQAGVPLLLGITLLEASSGDPVQGAAVDIWQCNPLGVYSDESAEKTLGRTYLRGVQLTDSSGLAQFVTLYPGHYAGRAPHIHARVHIGGTTGNGTYSGGHVAHTGQLFFSDSVSTRVFATEPYRKDKIARVLNSADRVYTEQGGSQSEVKLKRRSGELAKRGFTAAVTLAVDPNATPSAVGTGTGTATSGGGSGVPGGGKPGAKPSA